MVNPFKLAQQKAHLEGQIDIAEMERLLSSLSDSTGAIQYVLDFDQNDQGTAYVTGSFSGDVEMSCQRCLKSMSVSLSHKIQVEFLGDEDQEPCLEDEGFESFPLLAETMELIPLVEEEVILALPIAPIHGETECSAGESVTDTHKGRPEKENPFNVLSELKNNQES